MRIQVDRAMRIVLGFGLFAVLGMAADAQAQTRKPKQAAPKRTDRVDTAILNLEGDRNQVFLEKKIRAEINRTLLRLRAAEQAADNAAVEKAEAAGMGSGSRGGRVFDSMSDFLRSAQEQALASHANSRLKRFRNKEADKQVEMIQQEIKSLNEALQRMSAARVARRGLQ